jgi:hypothetical protein
MKRLHIPVILILVLSLLLPFQYIAASPSLAASAATEKNLLAVDSSSQTLFAYFNTGNRLLFRSEDGGYTWKNSGLGTNLNGSSLVALETSPTYYSDRTISAATASALYQSTDGGVTFSRILSLPYDNVTGNFTSLACGAGGKLAAGTTTGQTGGGIVFYNDQVWQNLEIAGKDVLSLAFSPRENYSGWLLAGTYDGESVQVENWIDDGGWNKAYPAALLYSPEPVEPQSAELTIYNGDDNSPFSQVFVAVNGTGSGSDLYKIRYGNESLSVVDMDVNGKNTSCSVQSAALAGSTSNGHLAAGLAGSNMVKRRTDIENISGAWSDSTFPPGGSANVNLKYVRGEGAILYAVTTGPGCGVYYSWDYGDIFQPLPPNHTPAVDDLKVTGTSVDSVSLAWTVPDDSDDSGEHSTPYPPDNATNIATRLTFQWRGSEGTPTYDFQLSETSDFSKLVENQTGLERTYWTTINRLKNSTLYYWQIRYNWDGEYSDWETRSFSTAAYSGHTAYDIRYYTQIVNSDTWDRATQCSGEPAPKAPGATQSFTVPGLRSRTTYYFALKIGDKMLNWSDISNCVAGTTKTPSNGDGVPPGRVTDLKVIATTGDSAVLQWTAPGDDEYSGTATRYDIRYREKKVFDVSAWDSLQQAAGEPAPQPAGSLEKFTVKGLQSDTDYYFAIRTADEVFNWSKLSVLAVGTTQDTTPPDPITDLQVSASTTDSLSLTWTASGDDGLIGTASHYDIRYTTQEGNEDYKTWKAVAGPQPKKVGQKEQLTINNLASDTLFYVIIRVADEVPNWSAMSPQVTGRTQAKPAPPTSTTNPPTLTPTPKGTVTSGDAIIHTTSSPQRDDKPLPVAAIFKVTDLKVSKEKASPGEALVVTATISNNGNVTGDYIAQLMVNGQVESQAAVSALAAGAQDSVQFEFKKDAAGSYNLQVGEKTSVIKVVKPIRSWVWILIAFVILLIILLILRQVLHWGFKGDKK